jgi:hypothetical protein
MRSAHDDWGGVLFFLPLDYAFYRVHPLATHPNHLVSSELEGDELSPADFLSNDVALWKVLVEGLASPLSHPLLVLQQAPSPKFARGV